MLRIGSHELRNRCVLLIVMRIFIAVTLFFLLLLALSFQALISFVMSTAERAVRSAIEGSCKALVANTLTISVGARGVDHLRTLHMWQMI